MYVQFQDHVPIFEHINSTQKGHGAQTLQVCSAEHEQLGEIGTASRTGIPGRAVVSGWTSCAQKGFISTHFGLVAVRGLQTLSPSFPGVIYILWEI